MEKKLFKSFFAILTLIALVFTGCNKDSVDNGDDNGGGNTNNTAPLVGKQWRLDTFDHGQQDLTVLISFNSKTTFEASVTKYNKSGKTTTYPIHGTYSLVGSMLMFDYGDGMIEVWCNKSGNGKTLAGTEWTRKDGDSQVKYVIGASNYSIYYQHGKEDYYEDSYPYSYDGETYSVIFGEQHFTLNCGTILHDMSSNKTEQ